MSSESPAAWRIRCLHASLAPPALRGMISPSPKRFYSAVTVTSGAGDS